MVNISDGVNNLADLRDEVFSRQKILAKIYGESAKKSLFEYVNSWPISQPSEETKIFFGRVQKLLLKTCPAPLAEAVFKETSSVPLISTIDHHGILNHPFFINSNLIYSQRRGLKHLLCFSSSSISLNNSSWPGCLLITDRNGILRRFSFFPDKIKTRTVLGSRPFGPSETLRVSNQIKGADFLGQEKKSLLLNLTEEIFTLPEVFEFKDFSGQAAFVSRRLWGKIFPGAPELVYLPLEELAASLIISEIAKDKNNILHKIFFTTAGWDSVEKYFQGSLGAFSGNHKGSFLFWGLRNGHRAHLARRGQVLVDHDFSVPLDIERITGLLGTKELYPTTLACFLVLLYFGVTSLGGFNQVNWLTGIKEKFISLLKERGERNLAERIVKIPTENFAEGSLAFGVNEMGQVYKPTGLDIFLHNDTGIYEKYRQLALGIPLGDSIDAQLPEIYKVITKAESRDSKFLGVTEGDILNNSHLADKISAILNGR